MRSTRVCGIVVRSIYGFELSTLPHIHRPYSWSFSVLRNLSDSEKAGRHVLVLHVFIYLLFYYFVFGGLEGAELLGF